MCCADRVAEWQEVESAGATHGAGETAQGVTDDGATQLHMLVQNNGDTVAQVHGDFGGQPVTWSSRSWL